MLRAILGIYTFGIVVVFLLLLFMRPAMPLIEAVLTALVWPYGLYLLIVEKVDASTKSGLSPAGSLAALAVSAGYRRIRGCRKGRPTPEPVEHR